MKKIFFILLFFTKLAYGQGNKVTLYPGGGGGGGSETDPVVKAINGVVKSNGTTISAATAGTDYVTPTGSAAALTSFPTLNQNTTGSAATWTTGRTVGITGDITYTSPSLNGSSNITAAATIANDAVTFAKFQNLTQARLLGRYTASTGDMQEITLGSGLSLNASTGELTSSGGAGGFGNTTLSGAVTITGAANSIAWNGIPANVFNDGTTNRIGYTGTNSYINSPDGFNNFTSDNTRNTVEGLLRLTALAGSGIGDIEIDNDGDVAFSSRAWQSISDGATLTFDAAAYINASTTLGGNRTLAFSNLSSAVGKTLTYEFIQDGTGSRTITLPGICKVVNGGSGAITLTTTPGAADIIQFVVKTTSLVYVTFGPNFN